MSKIIITMVGIVLVATMFAPVVERAVHSPSRVSSSLVGVTR